MRLSRLVKITECGTRFHISTSFFRVYTENPSREYIDQAIQFVRALKNLFPDTHFSLPSSDVVFRCLEELAKQDLGVVDFPFGGAHLLIGPEAHR